MALIAGTLKLIVNDPVIHLVVFVELALPVVRKSVPEETKHVSDDQRQHCHLHDLCDRQDSAVIRNLVITMRVTVATLEEVEHFFLGDELRCAQTRDSQHLEKKQVSLRLLIIRGFNC